MDYVTVIIWDYCLQYTFSKGWERCPGGFFFALLSFNCSQIANFVQFFALFLPPLSSPFFCSFLSCIQFLNRHTVGFYP